MVNAPSVMESQVNGISERTSAAACSLMDYVDVRMALGHRSHRFDVRGRLGVVSYDPRTVVLADGERCDRQPGVARVFGTVTP